MRLTATILLIVVCLAAPTAVQAHDPVYESLIARSQEHPPPSITAPDTVGPPAPGEAWRMRGLVSPLKKHSTGGQRLLRTFGYIPYGLTEAMGRPVYWAARLDERHHLVRRLSRLMVWHVEPMDTRLSARIGYETGFGLTIIGLNARSSDWLGTGIDYDMTVGYLNPRNNIFSLRLHGQEDDLWLSLLTSFERKDNRPFYGLGQSSPDLRTDAHRQFVLNELTLHARPAPRWLATVSIHQRHTDLDEPEEGLEDIGDDEHPTVKQTFPTLFGAAETSRYDGIEFNLSLDTRNDGDFSTAGALLRATCGYDRATSQANADYRHYCAEVQFFKAIWRGDRTLAARLYAEGMDTPDRDAVPYTEMAALGGRHTLRGFASDRFRDTHAALATVEYHYPVSPWIQGRVFCDWGTVAPDWTSMGSERTAFSAGMALAVRYHESTFTLQYARSCEGGHVYIGTGSVFGQKPRRER